MGIIIVVKECKSFETSYFEICEKLRDFQDIEPFFIFRYFEYVIYQNFTFLLKIEAIV
jgi:hypothetical protein